MQELSEFHNDSTKSDGKYSSCKECNRAVWTSKEYREKRQHPRYATIKRNFKAKTFGLNTEQYEDLIKKCENSCRICGINQKDLKKLLSIDHDHKTGKVRGLLCVKCNFGIGYFNDDPELMKKAIKYVQGA